MDKLMKAPVCADLYAFGIGISELLLWKVKQAKI